MGKPLPGRQAKLGADGEVLVIGPMASWATWNGGSLHVREGEWLATGDLAEAQPTGELRFVGRKSETIVTGAGVTVHPEDLEAVLEAEPEVAACAVVGVGDGAMGIQALAPRRPPPARPAGLGRLCRERMPGWLSFSGFDDGRCGRSRICRGLRRVR